MCVTARSKYLQIGERAALLPEERGRGKKLMVKELKKEGLSRRCIL